jgi:thioredoxin-related protein
MKGLNKTTMIFRIIALQLLGFIAIPLVAQKYDSGGKETREIDTLKWYSFNEGHSKAVRENKILMVNVSTESCYGCKLMFKHTYTHRGVIDTLNKYFICVYFNPQIDSSYLLNGNKVTPKQLIKYLFVDEQVAYPTALFWYHPESEEKHSVHSGFKEPPIFLKLLSAANAMRPFGFLGINLKMD